MKQPNYLNTIFVCCILFFPLYVLAQEVQYDSSILQQFDDDEWVRVIVVIRDESNIIITGTDEERKNLTYLKLEWFKPVIEEIIQNLTNEEFVVSNRMSFGFHGHISKTGFSKLINDYRLKGIYLNVRVRGGNGDINFTTNISKNSSSNNINATIKNSTILNTSIITNQSLNKTIIKKKLFCT